MNYIRIREIEIYHPEHKVNNDYYIEHFKQQGRDVTSFVEDVLGRKNRYLINSEEENSLTMAIEASKRVLGKAKLDGKDLDMIVFSSQTPEYTAASNAVHLHRELQAASKTMVMDSNANCAGMTMAIDHASRYMLSNPHIETVLVVGSDHNSLMANPKEEITYANFGDAACAVILEKTVEETGFIDSIYFTDSVNFNKTNFPREGLSKALKGSGSDQTIQWTPFDGSIAMPPTYEMFETVLSRNDMTMEDIQAFCLSQFSISNILTIQEHYQLKDSQIMYAGDKYGYTGTTSPLMAFYEGINTGRIHRGDTVLFWTIGGGYQLVAMLFKY